MTTWHAHTFVTIWNTKNSILWSRVCVCVRACVRARVCAVKRGMKIARFSSILCILWFSLLVLFFLYRPLSQPTVLQSIHCIIIHFIRTGQRTIGQDSAVQCCIMQCLTTLSRQALYRCMSTLRCTHVHTCANRRSKPLQEENKWTIEYWRMVGKGKEGIMLRRMQWRGEPGQGEGQQ